ncbi:MAG: hypothetical protein J6W81_07410 [Lentisphaeria bacterium]|nr:hypothetical protein [Lentisphaeria bacterium]
MSVLNRIINILVLLAAIAAVVFSYMLFSKREKLTDGWDKMAKAINTTARTLDDNSASGTTAARDLPVDKLKHQNYDQLGQLLPKLNDNAEKIVKQRNDLAASIQNVANTLSITGIKDENLKNIASYKDQERNFVNKVRQFRTVRDSVSAGYAGTAAKLGGRVSASEFNNSTTYGAAIRKVNAAADELIARRNAYANYLTQIARAMGVKAPNLSSKGYQAELAKTLNEFKKKQREHATTRSLLAREKSKSASLTKQVASRNNTIKSQVANIQKQKNRIDELNRILNKDGSLPLPEKLLTGSEPECYKYVKGKIEFVDKEFGFVTINIGSSFVFKQRYGIKDNYVSFPLQAGKQLSVARNLEGDDPVGPTFVGKLLVSKVDKNSAVCNLVTGSPVDYQVGDTVFFSEDDIVDALSGKAAKK